MFWGRAVKAPHVFLDVILAFSFLVIIKNNITQNSSSNQMYEYSENYGAGWNLQISL